MFEQNIETLLSLIGQKKELPERNIGENKSKIDWSLLTHWLWYSSRLANTPAFSVCFQVYTFHIAKIYSYELGSVVAVMLMWPHPATSEHLLVAVQALNMGDHLYVHWMLD